MTKVTTECQHRERTKAQCLTKLSQNHYCNRLFMMASMKTRRTLCIRNIALLEVNINSSTRDVGDEVVDEANVRTPPTRRSRKKLEN